MTEPNAQPMPTAEELAAKTAAEMAIEASDLLASRPGAGNDNASKTGAGKAGIDGQPQKSAEKGADKPRPQIDSLRETIESIAVAFILAFLFRTFVAEAFVIPTGSMATTLMGRHKDLECPNCRHEFQASASSECDKNGDLLPNVQVESVICPNCGMPIDTREATKYPSYKGDRIIVSKLSSDGPKRWDVTVFRYPEEAGTNYIKRLVGLPGEVIKIQNGDLHARPIDDPSQASRILRKPPDVVLAMLRNVHDNDRTPAWMTEAGWPPRWQPCPTDIVSLVNSGWSKDNSAPWPWPAPGPAQPGQWTTDDYRSFATDGAAQGEAWIRYQHYRPGPDMWHESLIFRAPAEVIQAFHLEGDWPKARETTRQALLKGKPPESLPPLRPVLHAISDLSGYNSSSTGGSEPEHHANWVGDLAVACEVSPAEPRGEVVLELIEAGHRFRCHLHLADGSLRLTADEGKLRFESDDGQSSAEVAAKGVVPVGKPFRVLFANVDSQLLVWIDDSLVAFEGPTTYSLHVKQMDPRLSRGDETLTPADYSPVGIASLGANVRVSHVQLLRDVYYQTHMYRLGESDHPDGVEYPLRKDSKDPAGHQFFMLGDNSAQSQDARAWSRQYVDRKLLIGKALFIFWPHSWDTPLPFTPNWKRMQFIR